MTKKAISHKKITTTKKVATKKKSTAKKAAPKKSVVKKSTATKSPAKKSSPKKTTAKKSTSKKPVKKYGSQAGKEVEKEMHKFKEGTAKSGKVEAPVESREQAIAIGLSKARKKGAKVPKKSE